MALRSTVGALLGGADTLTTTESLALPPAPVQVRVYVKVLGPDTLPVDWEPLIDLLPDQAPEAVQLVALVVVQERVADEL